MKSWLKWSLAGSLGLCAWAILFPAQEAPKMARGAAVSPDISSELHASATARLPSPAPRPGLPLPVDLPQPQFEPAAADPFVGPKPPAPPPAVVVDVAAPPPPAPAAPNLNYRFLGRVVDPDGQTQIYLSRVDKDLRVAKGTQLDEGYVVEAIKPDAVLLYYAPLDFHTQIRIPPLDTSP